MRKAMLFALSLGTGLGIGTGLSHSFSIDSAKASPQSVKDYNPSISLAPLVEQMSPAVVNIEIEAEVEVPRQLAPWGFQFPEDGRIQTGQGSGFLISEDGYILTNNHVIEGADAVKVRLSNDSVHEGKVIGADDSTDVALIKITGEDLPFVELGESDELKVGDWVVAIGNPFGLAHTVTAGIISAKGRVIGAGPYDDFIQTDASINPGNSGGPLFNLAGEVVGINTAINPKAQGIGFSVPIDTVKEILEDLKHQGHASRGWLGIALRGLDETSLKRNKISGGALVAEVYPNTPAADAGLLPSDIITHFDGAPVEDQDSLVRQVGKKRAGQTVSFGILRNSRSESIDVKLGERPSEKDLAQRSHEERNDNKSLELGIQVSPVSGFDSRNPRASGLVVLSVDRRGRAGGVLQPGDVIFRASGKSVPDLATLQALLSGARSIELEFLRNGKARSAKLQLR
jgi:serine protease Do